jgi:hypothetical protein
MLYEEFNIFIKIKLVYIYIVTFVHWNIVYSTQNQLSQVLCEKYLLVSETSKTDKTVIGQRRNLKSRLFKELNQPIDYTPKYTFKR